MTDETDGDQYAPKEFNDANIRAARRFKVERDEAIEVVKRLRAILHYDDPLALWTDGFLNRVGGAR